MKLDTRTVAAVPSLGLVKMEDRKRPVMADSEDAAPPAKRQATVNGAKPVSDDADSHLKELELYQKDAILRQMKEYKREKAVLEAQVVEMEKKTAYHDEHLHVIDSWFAQLIDEVRVIVNDTLASMGQQQHDDAERFPTWLFFADIEKFQQHLSSRSDTIKGLLNDLFSKIPSSSTDVRQLQERITKLLASEKSHIAELRKVTAEKEQLSERLENASYRYMVAEKKLDRAKSATVAKLERQATQSSRPEPTEVKGEDSGETSGVEESSNHAEAEAARRSAVAVAAKRKEQLEELEAANKKLTEEVTALTVRFAGLSDDDYAKTNLFKALKSQHEDVIKRINHLEATNVQLREEAQKLQAERTAYRMQMDEETRNAISEVDSQLSQAEMNLTRIRNSRDELIVEAAMKKAALDEQHMSSDQIKELAGARESRIAALEVEVERLRTQCGEIQPLSADPEALAAMSVEELRTKVSTLEKSYELLNNELPSMQAAWQKAHQLANKKIAEIVSWEEQVQRLTAEKAKADQKYFGAMKAKEAREIENRTMRAQNVRSSEIITQLKEADSSSQNLVSNLEKQLAEAKEQLNVLSQQHRTLQQKLTDATINAEGLNSQIVELKKVLLAKDSASLAASIAQREAEVKVEELNVKLAEMSKSFEKLKKSGKESGGKNAKQEMLIDMIYCSVCKSEKKNTALTTCGHMFCRACVNKQISLRSRKCPACLKAFGANDHMPVYFNQYDN
ncbi:E3 ubiquitin-protein ligase bre1 [Coniosporium apollinis]|uniref:E3 ubiquitin protein ligase n=1 Tax=Coniosporium apollinis TaxID=61459 RepID=A0ABQ9NUP7_9PEZI|nr:E3 ubiquitin-protein ligase bre1 [Coniosporium apollinis]